MDTFSWWYEKEIKKLEAKNRKLQQEITKLEEGIRLRDSIIRAQKKVNDDAAKRWITEEGYW